MQSNCGQVIKCLVQIAFDVCLDIDALVVDADGLDADESGQIFEAVLEQLRLVLLELEVDGESEVGLDVAAEPVKEVCAQGVEERGDVGGGDERGVGVAHQTQVGQGVAQRVNHEVQLLGNVGVLVDVC